MKRMTWAFIAIAFVGLCSAFTTVKHKSGASIWIRAIQLQSDGNYYVFDNNTNTPNTFDAKVVDPASDLGVTYVCSTGSTDELCLIEIDEDNLASVTNPSSGVFYFTPGLVQASEINKEFTPLP